LLAYNALDCNLGNNAIQEPKVELLMPTIAYKKKINNKLVKN